MNYKPSRLFFDIETEANHEACLLMPEPKAPGNFKDPAKIEAAIAEKKAEQLASAALDPDYGKIISIGMCKDVDGSVHVFAVGDEVMDPVYNADGEVIGEEKYLLTEKDLLHTFWNAFADCRGNCIGYNILGFDLPYLMRRSMALNVNIPHLPNLRRYSLEPVTDLMMILYNWGSDRFKGLKTVAKLYGIPNECEGVDGSQVATLDRETLRAYQASDVRLTIELFKKMNGVYFRF